MSKKKGKKAKRLKRMMREMNAMQQGGYGITGRGGLSGLLPKGRSEQFLLGLAVGGAAAWLLSDEDLRGKIMRSGLKLYANVAGGLEEMKEQMSDIQAELAAEDDGTA